MIDIKTPKFRNDIYQVPTGETNNLDFKGNNRINFTFPSNYNFLIVCIGNLTGTRSFSKFAKFCNIYGGVNFILAYLFVAIFVGVPILFADILIGIYTGSGIFSIVIGMKGINYSHIIITSIFTLQSFISTTVSLVYVVQSFNYPLPWSHCNNSWNDKSCLTALGDNLTYSTSQFRLSNSQYLSYILQNKEMINDELVFVDVSNWHFNYENPLVFYLIAVLIIYVLIEIFMEPFMTYISPILVSYTLVMAIIMVMLGVTFPGSGFGLKRLVIPKMEKVLRINLWIDVSRQVIYTYGLGYGSMLTIASHSSFSSNIKRNLWIMVLVEFLMNFVGSIATVEFLGAYEKTYNTIFHDFARETMFLLFFSSILMEFPYYNLLAFGLYSLIFIQHISTQIVNAEVLNLSLVELFNINKDDRKKINLIRSFIYIISAIILIMITYIHLSFYVFNLLNEFCLYNSPIFVALFQVITISYLYGLTELDKRYKEMTFKKIPIWIKVCLYTICPIVLGIVGISKFCIDAGASYKFWKKNLNYPWYTSIIGWTLEMVVILPIPIYFIYSLIIYKIKNKNLKLIDCLKMIMKPNSNIYRY